MIEPREVTSALRLREIQSLVRRFGTSRDGHAIFAPSSAAMWLACSGSLLPNLTAADTAGEDAAYGTVAHALAEKWLKSGKRPSGDIGKTKDVSAGGKLYRILIDSEMLGYVEQYVEWCREQPGDHFVEQRIDLSWLTPVQDQGGTSDHGAMLPRHLTITDLKMGLGVKVFAEKNPQAMLYALGVMDAWDWAYSFERITIRICQPRLDHFDVWETTREELIEFAHYVRERADAAWRENAPRTPSPKGCRWCKVQTTCPAILEQLQTLADASFDDIEVQAAAAELAEPDPGTEAAYKNLQRVLGGVTFAAAEPAGLSTEYLAGVKKWAPFFRSWFASVDTELESRANGGEEVPGFYLAAGRSSRDWADEDEARAQLLHLGAAESDVEVRSLISPAQAEKVLRKLGHKPKQAAELLKPVVTRTPGKPTLAPKGDSRPDADEHAGSAFDDVSL